jgi:hypothetical protein
MNKDGTDGRLTTEKGKLVTIYYADGTVIKGKNGQWEQGGNRIVLEETYTEADQNTASNDSFLTGGTSTSSGVSSSSQETTTAFNENTSSTGKTTSTSRRTETESIIKESAGISSTSKDESKEENIISSVDMGREGRESNVKESISTRRTKESKEETESINRPIVDDLYEQEMKDDEENKSSTGIIDTSNALNVISNINENKDRREIEYEEINEEEIEELIEMVKDTEKLDKEEKMIIIEKLEGRQMSIEEILKLREKLSE